MDRQTRISRRWTFLGVQWFSLCASTAGGTWFLVGALKSCVPWHTEGRKKRISWPLILNVVLVFQIGEKLENCPYWCCTFNIYNVQWYYCSDSLVAQTVKRLPAMPETWVQSLGWEDPLEKEMATHSRTLAKKFHGWRTWWATVHGVTKSRTRLSDFTTSWVILLGLYPRWLDFYKIVFKQWMATRIWGLVRVVF